MSGFLVELEDNGQDFIKFITDESGVIIESKPFQTNFWKGGIIPLNQQVIGELCMIHHPPHIEFGYLKHKVISINKTV